MPLTLLQCASECLTKWTPAFVAAIAVFTYFSPGTFAWVKGQAQTSILGFIMLTQGWKYTTTLGSRGTYVSMPKVSRFWMYFPIPVAGVAMIIFELEAIYNDIKAFFVKEGEA